MIDYNPSSYINNVLLITNKTSTDTVVNILDIGVEDINVVTVLVGVTVVSLVDTIEVVGVTVVVSLVGNTKEVNVITAIVAEV